MASLIGYRRTSLIGLTLLATACFAFAFAPSLAVLMIARFGQGAGAGAGWIGGLGWLTARVEAGSRGSSLGVVVGAALGGGAVGPLLGALGAAWDATAVFVLAGCVTLIAAALVPLGGGSFREDGGGVGTVLRALLNPEAAMGLALMGTMGLMGGFLAAAAPLRLSERGIDEFGIGVAFTSAVAVQVVLAPFTGRLSDRLGWPRPALAAAVTAALLLVLTTIVGSDIGEIVGFAVAYAAVLSLWTPGTHAATIGMEAAKAPWSLAVGSINIVWATGAVVGAAGIPATGLSQTADSTFLLCAAWLVGVALLVTVFVSTRRRARAAAAA
jgi:DHA1 family bicyclomycin/chloramphenicol resistance-like MFS transporter